MTTKQQLRQEAAAWRECAEYFDRTTSAGVCGYRRYICNFLMSPAWYFGEALPSHWPHGRMLERCRVHAAEDTSEEFQETLDNYNRSPTDTRVLFCLFAAMEAEEESRFKRFVESRPRKLTCQDCGGMGGEVEPVLDYGEGPFMVCGWCEGTGLMTPHLRSLWLREKRKEAKER